jgi:hypothetical protein
MFTSPFFVSNMSRSFHTKALRRNTNTQGGVFRFGNKRVVPSPHPQTNMIRTEEAEFLQYQKELSKGIEQGKIFVFDKDLQKMTADEVRSWLPPVLEAAVAKIFPEPVKEEAEVAKEPIVEEEDYDAPEVDEELEGEATHLLEGSVAEIKEVLETEENADFISLCLRKEMKGKNRKSLVSWLEGHSALAGSPPMPDVS